MKDTKEAILLAALRLFSQSGYEAVSVRDISGALKISPGALYKHYPSKQAIFQSILERMQENDRQHALEFGLPADEYSVSPASYDNISLQSIAAFAEAQFRYWTEDDFASSFRRMLTIEQYRKPELRALYDGYLSTGPLCYTADMFRSKPDCDPIALALEFYSPLYMLISCYDSAEDKSEPLAAARAQIANFISKYKRK